MPESLSKLYNTNLPENPSWISGGVLPKHGVMLMGGLAKIGKTFLLMDLAHNVASGGGLWGLDIKVHEPAPVLYVEREVGVYEFQRRVKMRYDAAGEKPPEGLFYLSKPKGMFLDTGEGAAQLGKEIAACGAKVVVLDPISRFLLGDENSNTDIGALFRRLDELLGEFPDLSFVLSHHFGKPPREPDENFDPLSPYNYRGASKWFDAPDTLVTFERINGRGPGEWWRLRAGWELRQAPPMEVQTLAVYNGGVIGRAENKPLMAAKGWKK